MRKKRNRHGLTEQEELKAWSMLFSCGRDYFGDLELLRLPCEPEDEDFEAIVRSAWRRLGNAFLQNWIPTQARKEPWAMEQFGEP